MGSIYARGSRLYIGYKEADGKWNYVSTKLKVGAEEKARKVLEAIERRVAAPQRSGIQELGPPTVRTWAERWNAERQRRGIGSAGQEAARLRLYVLPRIGDMRLEAVRARNIRDVIRELRSQCGSGRDQIAPRTVRHIYGILHRMFEDAVAEELIDLNPCTLKRGELPKKADKDPIWRAQAVFRREEVERLLSDDAIPEQRRVLYALLFLAGLRIGEAAALRWRAYDSSVKPLGRLLVAVSFDRKQKREKSVKTERPRIVPVHPTLSRVLKQWKVGAWECLMGRPPKLDDLMVPSMEGQHLRDAVVLRRFHDDLRALGFRLRRVHDARRTFISLAQADGARRDILRWITHGPEGDIVSDYTTLPFETLCEEVVKLKIGLLEGEVVELPRAANSDACGGPLLQPLLQPSATEGKNHGRGGTRTLTPFGTRS